MLNRTDWKLGHCPQQSHKQCRPPNLLSNDEQNTEMTSHPRLQTRPKVRIRTDVTVGQGWRCADVDTPVYYRDKPDACRNSNPCAVAGSITEWIYGKSNSAMRFNKPCPQLSDAVNLRRISYDRTRYDGLCWVRSINSETFFGRRIAYTYKEIEVDVRLQQPLVSSCILSWSARNLKTRYRIPTGITLWQRPWFCATPLSI